MISLIRAAWQEEMRVPMFVGLATDGYPDSDDPAMKNGARCYHMDTGAEYEYSKDDDAWYPVPSGSGGASSWSSVTGKPFETIGDGLVVEEGVLSATNEYRTFIFRGYVSSTEPLTALSGDLWYEGSAMPESFPAQVKVYDGEAWSVETEEYTPASLEMWADLNSGHGYYWFGNEWNIIDVNVAIDNVTLGTNAQGQIEVKTPYRLPVVTSVDNGKFMRVVNGAWSATQVTTKAMEVTYDDDTTETFNILVEGN